MKPWEITLSAKGQTTLPKELREKLNPKPGDQLSYSVINEQIVLTPKNVGVNGLAGMLGPLPNGSASLDEIDGAVTDAAGANALDVTDDREAEAGRMKTYGLDTDVMIRCPTEDDPMQRRAALIFGAGPGKDHLGFLSLVAILELDRALRSKLGFARADVIKAVRKLLHTRGLTVESHDLVAKVLQLAEQDNADFADAMITCRSLDEGCEAVKTFDIKAVRRLPCMELLQ